MLKRLAKGSSKLAQNKLFLPVFSLQPALISSFFSQTRAASSGFPHLPFTCPSLWQNRIPSLSHFPSPGFSSIRPRQRLNSSSDVPLHPSSAFRVGSGPEEKYQIFVGPGSAQHILGLSPAQLVGPAQPSPFNIIYYILYCFVLFIYVYMF
jgi:hypothetical protein